MMGFDDRMKEITDTMSKNKIKAEIRKHTLHEKILEIVFNACLLALVIYTVFWVIKDLLSQSLWVYAALLLLIAEITIISLAEDSVLKGLRKAINEKDQKKVQTEHGNEA